MWASRLRFTFVQYAVSVDSNQPGTPVIFSVDAVKSITTGRGWPRTVQLDDETLGTLFYDLTESPGQVGGPSVWLHKTKIQDDLLPPDGQ